MKNIVLVGFMGTGKTTVGGIIAQELDMEFVNTDELIEKKEGAPVNEIFSKKGEPYFRKIEREVIMEVSGQEGTVIDAGGGAVINELNVEDLKKNGIVVCLNATPEEIFRRVEQYAHRPLLNVTDPLAEIKKLLKSRAGYYKRADYQVETTEKNADNVAREIIQLYVTFSKSNREAL